MEAAIEEAIHSTVATFVDKAVTGVIENTFAAAVDKAVAERVHAIEDHFAAAVDKAVEDKVKVIEEAMQEKIDRAEKMAKLKANMDAVCSPTHDNSIAMLMRQVLGRKGAGRAQRDSHQVCVKRP